MRPTARKEVSRREEGAAAESHWDSLAVEEPLEIRVGGKPLAITMRTPGDDAELAVGYLFTEGLIGCEADVSAIRPIFRKEECNAINVALSPGLRPELAAVKRRGYTSASCGICGKTAIDAVHRRFPPIRSELRFDAASLPAMADAMSAAQAGFEQTGGLHAAAVFNENGELLVLREDIGRHNAVDKSIGWGVLKRLLPYDRHLLLVSGRVSFEIIQKALSARIPIVAAVSAPSSLAVEFADRSGQTLVGFLRGRRMNVYAHPERLI